MVPLSRKVHESVIVGQPNGHELLLKVTVLAIREGSVILGFETDEDFPVEPWEAWERIRANGSHETSRQTELSPGHFE